MDAPFIAAFGPSKSTVCKIKLAIEKENVMNMPDTITAVNCSILCLQHFVFVRHLHFDEFIRGFLILVVLGMN